MKKSKDNLPASTKHTSKIHHPHDKFVRALLQEKAFTVQLLEYVLPAEVFNMLDISSLKITTNTFIDPELIGSYSDVCYEGVTIANEPLRISLIFEHKSDNPGVAIYDQLARYIVDGWAEDRRQGRTLTLSIPVLIHHGDTPVTLQTPAHVFPKAPAHLLPYVPAFKYDIIDVAAMSVETILALRFWTLRNTLLALKIGRDEKKVAQYLRELLIFASGDKDSPAYAHLVELTLIYLSNISKNAHMAIANIETILTPEEQEQIPPSIFGKYFVKGHEKGREEGIDIGIEKGIDIGIEKGIDIGIEKGIDIGIEKGTLRAIQHYIKKNPTATDHSIAELFEINLDLVHKARNSDPV